MRLGNYYQKRMDWGKVKDCVQRVGESVTDYHLQYSEIFRVHSGMVRPPGDNDSPYEQQEKTCFVEDLLPEIKKYVQKHCIELERGRLEPALTYARHAEKVMNNATEKETKIKNKMGERLQMAQLQAYEQQINRGRGKSRGGYRGRAPSRGKGRGYREQRGCFRCGSFEHRVKDCTEPEEEEMDDEWQHGPEEGVTVSHRKAEEQQEVEDNGVYDNWRRQEGRLETLWTFVNNVWYGPNGNPCLPKCLFPFLARLTQSKDHVSKTGMVATTNKYWYTQGFSNYSQNCCSKCLVCLRNNVGRGQKMKQTSHPTPDGPFDHLMMDFIELTPCEGKKYCLVIVDMFSKWIEIFPTGKADAEAVAKVLLREIIPRWGIPRKLTSDKGTHFVNKAIQQISEYLGLDLRNHCAYYPQSGGAVERENGTIKSKLKFVMRQDLVGSRPYL